MENAGAVYSYGGSEMSQLIMFHGRECPHCKKMHPVVDRLEQETGVAVSRLEVWHDEKNADLMRANRDLIASKCGGQLRVPTFLNKETEDVICGEVEYEKLKEWATR
jgi:thiol-disulfide isomerase/thioredoxin